MALETRLNRMRPVILPLGLSWLLHGTTLPRKGYFILGGLRSHIPGPLRHDLGKTCVYQSPPCYLSQLLCVLHKKYWICFVRGRGQELVLFIIYLKFCLFGEIYSHCLKHSQRKVFPHPLPAIHFLTVLLVLAVYLYYWFLVYPFRDFFCIVKQVLIYILQFASALSRFNLASCSFYLECLCLFSPPGRPPPHPWGSDCSFFLRSLPDQPHPDRWLFSFWCIHSAVQLTSFTVSLSTCLNACLFPLLDLFLGTELLYSRMPTVLHSSWNSLDI